MRKVDVRADWHDAWVLFSIHCADHGQHDVWAAPGTPWPEVLAQLAAPPSPARGPDVASHTPDRPARQPNQPAIRQGRTQALSQLAVPPGPPSQPDLTGRTPGRPAGQPNQPTTRRARRERSGPVNSPAPVGPSAQRPNGWPDSADRLIDCLRADHLWHAGTQRLTADDRIGSDPLLPGCVVRPRAHRPAGPPALGAWIWVPRGSPDSGAIIPVRPPADWPGPAVPPLTVRRRGRSRLAIRPPRGDPTNIWVAQPRRRRPTRKPGVGSSGMVPGRWRRLKRRWRAVRADSLVRAEGQTWELRRCRKPAPRPSSLESASSPAASARPGRALIPAVATMATSVVMAVSTRNLLFALVPVLGTLGLLIPGASLTGRRSPTSLGLDAASLLIGPVTDLDEVGVGLPLTPWDHLVTPGSRLAVVGDSAAVAALVRTWVIEACLARPPGTLAISHPPDDEAWAWSRWLPVNQPGLRLAIAEGSVAPHPDTVGIVRLDHPPAWRGDVVEVKRGGAGLLLARLNGGPPVSVLPFGWRTAETVARAIAAVTPAPRPSADLASALPMATTAGRWEQAGLDVPLGFSLGDGTLVVDLPRDGPHLLVAGATGSGKSEFLRTLILACALRASPADLTIVGIDHKGGATFADLAGLPHLAGVVTDLDIPASIRALASIGAELTDRERTLEALGARDMRDLPDGQRPPRILVVVDEFRELIEAVPEAAASLERLAAQGRSLGLHLVLATQRPAGAVSAQLRANLALRVCFRVADQADSLDVIGTADAAAIDPQMPGTAIVASSGRPNLTMRAFPASICAPPPARLVQWPRRWAPPTAPRPQDPAGLVTHLAQLAAGAGLAQATPPWRPALPALITLDDLPPGPGDGQTIRLGLADDPDHLAQYVLTAKRSDGDILVIGAPRSGRTSTARTIAVEALAQGWPVHVITGHPAAFTDLVGHPYFGTLAPLGATRLIGRLLSLLRHGAGDDQTVLIVDDAEALADMPVPGFEGHPLDRRSSPRLWTVATCAARSASARWCSRFSARLILPVLGRGEDLALGLPARLAGSRNDPGRAIWTHRGTELLTQVALAPVRPIPAASSGPAGLTIVGPPSAQPQTASPPATTALGSPPGLTVVGPTLAPPLTAPPAAFTPGLTSAGIGAIPRLEALPERVDLSGLPRPRADLVWVGRGGDEAGPLSLGLSPGLPIGIVGPHASGRTTVLNAIAAQLLQAEIPHRAIDAHQIGAWDRIRCALEAGEVVLVDDIDDATGPAPTSLPATGVLIATLATSRAIGFTGPGPLLRTRPHGIILWPTSPASAEVYGLRLTEAFDPDAERRPGYGALVTKGQVTAIQCVAAEPEGRNRPNFA